MWRGGLNGDEMSLWKGQSLRPALRLIEAESETADNGLGLDAHGSPKVLVRTRIFSRLCHTAKAAANGITEWYIGSSKTYSRLLSLDKFSRK